MKYPDFLCIGARKAGTTWLHENLAKQPAVYLPPVKEMHYLDHSHTWLFQRLFGRAAYLRNAREHLGKSLLAFRRGGSWQELKWAAKYCLMPRNDTWYQSLFSSEDRLCGEVCPGYARLGLDQVAAVAKRMPDTRIIYFMRDPLECAWSSAGAHFSKKGRGVGVMQENPEDVKRYLAKSSSVLHLSFARNLANWREHYPEEQILLSYFDDLKSNPRDVYKRVLRFIGLDDSDEFIPSDVVQKLGTKEGRRSREIPEDYAFFLAKLYVDSLEELNVLVDNEHARRWLADARAILDA